MNDILNDATLKPWQKTSYFILLVAVVIGGAAITFGTSLYLPQLTYLSDEQRAEILKTMFDGWATLSSIVVGGNVVARGGLTLLKQWLQNQLVKSAAGIPETPQTVNAGGDVTLNAGELPPSQHQPQNTVPAPAPTASPLPMGESLPLFVADPTVPRNEYGANVVDASVVSANVVGTNVVRTKATDYGDSEGDEDYERTPG